MREQRPFTMIHTHTLQCKHMNTSRHAHARCGCRREGGREAFRDRVGREDHWQVKESERKDLDELVQNKTYLFRTRLHSNF